MEKFYRKWYFMLVFVLLLSRLPMFENVKVITQKGGKLQANINFTEPAIKFSESWSVSYEKQASPNEFYDPEII